MANASLSSYGLQVSFELTWRDYFRYVLQGCSSVLLLPGVRCLLVCLCLCISKCYCIVSSYKVDPHYFGHHLLAHAQYCTSNKGVRHARMSYA